MNNEFCTNNNNHEYADNTCPICGQVFCWACCARTNVHEGGKYQPDYMHCPRCGHDIYLVEVCRRETGEYASPATWLEVESGNKPICKTVGREKVWFVEAGEKYRVCHASGMADTQYSQWKTA